MVLRYSDDDETVTALCHLGTGISSE